MTISKGKMQSSTLAEKMAIKELLDQYLHPIENTKFFRYEDSWNDQRIAGEINPALTFTHAKFVRLQMFGSLKKQGRGKSNSPRLKGRVDVLETQIRKLVGAVGLTLEEQKIVMGITYDPENKEEDAGQ
jgi:hypothetical protein